MDRVKELAKKNTMLLALVFIMLLFEAMIKSTSGSGASLFAPTNITNLINQNGYVVILACGMLLCILSGGNIDLSVGSVVALVGAITGTMVVDWHMNVWFAIIVSLLVGMLIGAWQGFWIAYVRIPAFIVTLSGMLTFRGLSLIMLRGLTISPFPDSYSKYFNSYLPGTNSTPETRMTVTLMIAAAVCIAIVLVEAFGRIQKVRKKYAVEPLGFVIGRDAVVCIVILAAFYRLGQNKGMPVILILLAVVVLLYNYYTRNTVPGRRLYAMGGNEKAARLSGINTDRLLFFAYTNMGFLSALAALVCVARFNASTPSAGTNYEMDAIGACYIGGASARGGIGTVPGAVIGAIFMGVLNNGMSILGIDSNWQRTVKGIVLLIAVVYDVLSRRKSVSNT